MIGNLLLLLLTIATANGQATSEYNSKRFARQLDNSRLSSSDIREDGIRSFESESNDFARRPPSSWLSSSEIEEVRSRSGFSIQGYVGADVVHRIISSTKRSQSPNEPKGLNLFICIQSIHTGIVASLF